jgi:DNA-binding CsgD family transcriptional regulator/tetratricopeptide (TPR) repeat protein
VLVRLGGALAQVEPLVTVRLLERALDLVDDARARGPIAVGLGMASLAVQAAPHASEVLRRVFDALETELGEHPSVADAALRTLVESMLVITGIDEKSTVGRTMAWVAERRPPDGDGPGERQLLAMHAAVAALSGGSSATAAEYGRRALGADDVMLGGWAVLGASLALHLADEVDPAQKALSRLVAHSRSRGELWTYCLGLTTRALYRLQTGQLADAAADAQISYDLVREELWGAGMTTPQVVLAHVLVQQGESVRAEELLDGITRPRFDHFSLEYHWFLMARARAREALGDLDGALGYLLACGDSLVEAHIGSPVLAPWWLDGSSVLARLGRGTEARDLAERGAEQAERWGTPSARGMGLLARGAVAEGDAGIDLLTEAADVLSGSVAPLVYAKAEYLLGTRLIERGDLKGARDRLRRSLDQSVLVGDRLLLEPTRAALVKAGGRLRTGVASATDMLTGSERRVAAMAADGATNRAIAEQLFVTVRTVETHLTSAYRKLDISGRAELAAALGPQQRHA